MRKILKWSAGVLLVLVLLPVLYLSFLYFTKLSPQQRERCLTIDNPNVVMSASEAVLSRLILTPLCILLDSGQMKIDPDHPL